jgi:hypothetical protein
VDDVHEQVMGTDTDLGTDTDGHDDADLTPEPTSADAAS